jgi:hypothetical protein
MTLMDDLANVSKATYLCSVKQLLNSLPKNEAEAIAKAIDDPETSATALSRVLAKHGHELNRKTIARHRWRGNKEKGCVCQ